jgi:hypothetical protein
MIHLRGSLEQSGPDLSFFRDRIQNGGYPDDGCVEITNCERPGSELRNRYQTYIAPLSRLS